MVSGFPPQPDCVALAVQDENDRLLVFWHEKHQFWTIPLGKVAVSETEAEAVHREAYEELGVVVSEVELVCAIRKPIDIDEYSGINISVFRISSYQGEISNREPHKHKNLGFFDVGELTSLAPISFPTQLLLDRLGR